MEGLVLGCGMWDVGWDLGFGLWDVELGPQAIGSAKANTAFWWGLWWGCEGCGYALNLL